MSKHLPALAARAAIVTTAAAAATVVGVLPATAVAAPAAPVPPAAATPVRTITASPAAFAEPTVPAAAVARATALDHAMSKIGSPYRYGATGPNAFDCSGLVSWAFKKAGVSLPRTSRAMSQVGTPISRDELRPGDLVFFYRPVSHVGIYIGDGKIVHASSRKSPVKISDMGRMKFNTARRI